MESHILNPSSTTTSPIPSICGSQVNFTPWFVNFLERGIGRFEVQGVGSQTLFLWKKNGCYLFSDLLHLKLGLVCYFPPVHPSAKVPRIKTLKAVPKFLKRICRQTCLSIFIQFPPKCPGCAGSERGFVIRLTIELSIH